MIMFYLIWMAVCSSAAIVTFGCVAITVVNVVEYVWDFINER